MSYQVIIRLSCQLNKTFNIPNIVLMNLFPQCCDGIPKYHFSVDNNKVELGYISKSREGGVLHFTNTLLHGALKAATFHQRQPSQAQRLKSGNRWQLGGGFNNRGAGLRIHSYSFIYLFYIFLQPTANYSIKARNNSIFSLEFCKRSSLSMSASNLVLLGAQMSHFWGYVLTSFQQYQRSAHIHLPSALTQCAPSTRLTAESILTTWKRP